MGKIIAFAGPEHSGRTTLVLNTAYLLMKRGHKTLVIDADQMMGRVICHLNLDENPYGLCEAVTRVDIDRFDPYCVTDRKTGLTVMTMPTNAECCAYRALSAEQADNFYEKIKRSYDYVLVDCGNIVYEALSCCALLHAKKTFIVLPQEKRSAVWLTATEAMLADLQLSKLQYIITQLQEVADVTIDQVLSSVGDSGSIGILGSNGSPGGNGSPGRLHALRIGSPNSLGSTEGIASIGIVGSLARTSSPWSRLLGVIPYLFNLRDYQAAGTMFLQSPSGKKSKEFAKGIEQLVREIEEVENV